MVVRLGCPRRGGAVSGHRVLLRSGVRSVSTEFSGWWGRGSCSVEGASGVARFQVALFRRNSQVAAGRSLSGASAPASRCGRWLGGAALSVSGPPRADRVGRRSAFSAVSGRSASVAVPPLGSAFLRSMPLLPSLPVGSVGRTWFSLDRFKLDHYPLGGYAHGAPGVLLAARFVVMLATARVSGLSGVTPALAGSLRRSPRAR